MKSRQNDFVLGMTAIVFVAVFLATILFLVPALRRGVTRIVVHFPHEKGMAPLKPGGQVMLSGALEVGTIQAVRALELPVDTPQGTKQELTIIVEADIDRDIQLYADCEITTDAPMVGGAGYLVIRSVGTPGNPLPPGEPIAGLPPRSMGAAVSELSERLLGRDGLVDQLEVLLDYNDERSLAYKIGSSLDDVNAMTEELRRQLQTGDGGTLLAKLHRMLDDVTAMSASLREQTAPDNNANMMAKLHAALDGMANVLSAATGLVQENREPIHEALLRVESMARSLEQDLFAALKGELSRDDPQSMLGKIHVSMDRLNASLADVKSITGEGRRLVVSNRPALERTLMNVQETSEQLRMASAEIRLAPWRLLYQPTERESDELSLFEAARTFAEAAAHLDDAAARLEAVSAATPDGRGAEADAEIRAVRNSVQTAFERFERAERFLWEKMK